MLVMKTNLKRCLKEFEFFVRIQHVPGLVLFRGNF